MWGLGLRRGGEFDGDELVRRRVMSSVDGREETGLVVDCIWVGSDLFSC